MAGPAQGRFESLHRLTADVWLDDTHLRQVRFVDGTQICTLALSDFGTDVDGLDWTRLSTFR